MKTVIDRRSGRSLVDQDLFHRLVRRVVSDEGYEVVLAERVVDQALAFLGACARHHGEPLSPSRIVDPGWHVFVLHA